MTDRDKLYNLIVSAENDLFREQLYTTDTDRICRVIDYLLESGVTVKEPQKPLTVEEVHAKQNEIMYLEYAQNKLEEFPVLLTFFGAFYAEFEKHGGEGTDFLIDEYNYKWRCWAENPTEEERKAAGWEM